MPIFAVTYVYTAPASQVDEIRPLHRAWLSDLLDQKVLLASGPMVDTLEALLIFRSESAEQLAKLLDNDPFDVSGCIGSRTIQSWNPVLGPFSS